MAADIEIGRRYHCQEQMTAKRRTGFFCYDADGIEARLFDYGEFFHLKDGASVNLRLENNTVVSLHHTLITGPGSHSFLGDPPATTYSTTVVANTAVAGHRAWKLDDPIRRVWFEIEQAKGIVEHRPIIAKLRHRKLPGSELRKPVFEAQGQGFRVLCWYAASGSFEFGISEWRPIFEIEYTSPRSLDSYLDGVHTLLQFFSAAAGFQLVPSKIKISGLTRTEADALLDSRAANGVEHSVKYIWNERHIDKADLHPRNSFAIAYDSRELRSLISCLEAWLRRDREWNKATTLMMGSLGLVKELSGHRLLMACRWLEAIPGAQADRLIPDYDVEEIALAAIKEAEARGFNGQGARLRGAIRTLRTETNQLRFERLVRNVESFFGPESFGGEALRHTTVPALMKAISLRGVEAHGYIDEGSDVRALQRATAAIEALCYLLTIEGLPMSKAGRERALARAVFVGAESFGIHTAPVF